MSVGTTEQSATGRRERKKQQTRQLIADAAARLFAQHGFERVAVSDVAAAADVSEQTVYNYFPTKERLVLDRDDELRDRLVQLIRDRPSGVTPAAAIRAEAMAFADGIRALPAEQVRGGLGRLAAISPTVRRMCLEMTDRHADAIADAIAATTNQSRPVAKVQAIALAWVFQTVTDESGKRSLAGADPTQIADELGPMVERLLDDLDRWYAVP
jgi:AcrR family transcriptional regulator